MTIAPLDAEPADLVPHRVTEAEYQARRGERRAEALAAGPPACCACGKPTTFASDIVGMTVGGLWLRGWYMCPEQHGTHAQGLAEVSEAPTWTVAKGGRSVEIGTGRIRYGQLKVESGERLDVAGLMARVAKLPELEREAIALRESLAWTLRIIDHELPPQPDPCGDEGEMQSQHYFAENMRAARALCTSESNSEEQSK